MCHLAHAAPHTRRQSRGRAGGRLCRCARLALCGRTIYRTGASCHRSRLPQACNRLLSLDRRRR